MKYNHKILFLLLLMVLGSCSNYSTYREIKSMFPRDITGIEELIRIDGYYYESSEEVYSPVVFTKNGEVKRYFVRFNSHERIHEHLIDLQPRPGYFIMIQDTIKMKWAFRVYPGQYTIHEEFFVSLNDTTLRRIYYAINGQESEAIGRSNIYRFYPFDVSGLK